MAPLEIYTLDMFVGTFEEARKKDPSIKVQRLRMPTTVPHRLANGRVEMRAAVTIDYVFTCGTESCRYRKTQVADDHGDIPLETEADRVIARVASSAGAADVIVPVHRSGSL